MLKQIAKISAVLFVGVFVFALAFTLTASSAHAFCRLYVCCEIKVGETVVGYGVQVWVDPLCVCTCAPMPGDNPNNCPMVCPDPE